MALMSLSFSPGEKNSTPSTIHEVVAARYCSGLAEIIDAYNFDTGLVLNELVLNLYLMNFVLDEFELNLWLQRLLKTRTHRGIIKRIQKKKAASDEGDDLLALSSWMRVRSGWVVKWSNSNPN